MTGEELNTVTPDTGATDTGGASAPVTEVMDEDAALSATFDRMVTNNGADRGENGKFTSPNPSPDTEGGKGGEPSAEEAGEGAEVVENPPVAGTAAPAHLPGGIKEQWEKIPEEARAAIVSHQTEMDRKFGEIGKQYGAIKPLADKLTEATQKFPDFAGMTPEQLAQGAIELGAVQVNLSRNPIGTIIEIAQHYKCLPQLVQALSGKEGETGGQDNQLVAGLQQKISNLESQLSKVSNPDTIRNTVSTAFLERETETLVQSFAAEDGKEYWAEVEADMPLYIRHVMERGIADGPKAILQAAYDMAINANPEVRVKVRAAEAKATAAPTDPKRTEAAKKAASINVPSNGSGKERQMTEDELLAASYDRKMAS